MADSKEIELRIFGLEDRLQVAAVLVKNGYRVSQKKAKRAGAKSYDYYLVAEEDPACLDSGR